MADIPKITVEYVYPPIPLRCYDYRAVFEGLYDGAPDAGKQYMGYGATKEEAIADLVNQWEEDQ